MAPGRFDDVKLAQMVCNGVSWTYVGGTPLGTQANPGQVCASLASTLAIA